MLYLHDAPVAFWPGHTYNGTFFSYAGGESALGINYPPYGTVWNDPGVTYAFQTYVGSTAAAVPEPATWAMMLAGFATAGAALRRRRVGQAITTVA